MNRTGVKIDRLNLRTRGMSSFVARDLVRGIGVDLMRHLSDQTPVLKGKRGLSIENIDCGKLRISGEKNPTNLRRMAAEKITSAILSKTTS